MAVKTSLSFAEIGKNLEVFRNPVVATEVPYILLKCIGISEALLNRFRHGSNVVASFEGLLIRKRLAFRIVLPGMLAEELETIKSDAKVRKYSPAILAVSDGVSIMAYDPAADETYINRRR